MSMSTLDVRDGENRTNVSQARINALNARINALELRENVISEEDARTVGASVRRMRRWSPDEFNSEGEENDDHEEEYAPLALGRYAPPALGRPRPAWQRPLAVMPMEMLAHQYASEVVYNSARARNEPETAVLSDSQREVVISMMLPDQRDTPSGSQTTQQQPPQASANSPRNPTQESEMSIENPRPVSSPFRYDFITYGLFNNNNNNSDYNNNNNDYNSSDYSSDEDSMPDLRPPEHFHDYALSVDPLETNVLRPGPRRYP